jgi:hypothetical protein
LVTEKHEARSTAALLPSVSGIIVSILKGIHEHTEKAISLVLTSLRMWRLASVAVAEIINRAVWTCATWLTAWWMLEATL